MLGFRRFSALMVTFLMLLLMLGLGFVRPSHSSQLEDLYGLLGLKAEYEYPHLSLKGYAASWFSLSGPPKPLLLAKYRFLLEEVLSPDKKWYSYLKQRGAEDPITVFNGLESYVLREVDGKRENFYYRFSWHVVGYDGSYYTVVLRLKIYYYDFVNMKPIYEFSEIVEPVMVSVYDRRVIYECVDVGVWPFWLMPWERYEGAKVELAEVSPFFELNNVSNPLNVLNITFDVKVKKASLGSALARYFRDALSIVAERVFEARTEVVDPISGMEVYRFTGEKEKFIGELWLEAYMKMLRKYYPQLYTKPTIIWGMGTGWVLFAPNNLYDTVTGVALKVFGVNDVFLMVVPLENYRHLNGFQDWLIVSITKEPPSSEDSVTVTCPVIITAKKTTTPQTTTPQTGEHTTTQTETTPATTTPTETATQIANVTITPLEVQNLTTTQLETRTELDQLTISRPGTVTTQEPARERATTTITAAKPPEPPKPVETRGGLLSFEIAIATLTLLILAVSIAVFILTSHRRV